MEPIHLGRTLEDVCYLLFYHLTAMLQKSFGCCVSTQSGFSNAASISAVVEFMDFLQTKVGYCNAANEFQRCLWDFWFCFSEFLGPQGYPEVPGEARASWAI